MHFSPTYFAQHLTELLQTTSTFLKEIDVASADMQVLMPLLLRWTGSVLTVQRWALSVLTVNKLHFFNILIAQLVSNGVTWKLINSLLETSFNLSSH